MASALSDEFVLPKNKEIGASKHADPERTCTYLCGNSLGPLSKRSKTLVEQELHAWGISGVSGHFDTHPYGRGWVAFCDHITPLFADIVGAKEKEVACMGTLTANLHLMMESFYKPTSERYKILCEAKAFPSDQYAFASQALAHGLDPAKAIIEMAPREGEYTLREQDILDKIAQEGSSIALVIFSGVQYYTGQWFPMQAITQGSSSPGTTIFTFFRGCICGWDLAHAVGNVPLSLHDWGVDFAVWCTYKYLNAGPGSIAGLYVHEKWNETELPKFAGWWGHDPATRFAMPPKFSPIEGAQGFQQSNPSILASCLTIRLSSKRSLELTGALEKLLLQSKYFVPVEEAAAPVGVIGDERQPDVIRLAPAPLFNTLKDCEEGALGLERAFDSIA
ncbi:pyridoxal phosphate-dependent transferase [Mycena rebaudengoi]|nr:pyridoxal phosphate-dependent transferase [Mycena rebaudengoi]